MDLKLSAQNGDLGLTLLRAFKSVLEFPQMKQSIGFVINKATHISNVLSWYFTVLFMSLGNTLGYHTQDIKHTKTQAMSSTGGGQQRPGHLQ